MHKFALIIAIWLLSSACEGDAGIYLSIEPENPTASTPITLKACRDFSDSCYSFFGSDWTMVGDKHLTTRLAVVDQHRPGYACATVITPICGQYQIGKLSPGRYTVRAEVDVYCIHPICTPRHETADFCFDVGPATSIWEARRALPGTTCNLQNSTVTASFTDGFYIQAAFGVPGLFVRKPGHTIATGAIVDVAGKTAVTSGREKCVDATQVFEKGSAGIGPVIIGTRSIGGGDWFTDCSNDSGQSGVRGGIGLNNTGLLIATTGRVTHIDAVEGWFTVWDGAWSALGPAQDWQGNNGVRVSAPTGAIPAVSSMVKIEGVISSASVGGDVYPVVRAVSGGITHLQ